MSTSNFSSKVMLALMTQVGSKMGSFCFRLCLGSRDMFGLWWRPRRNLGSDSKNDVFS